MSKQFTEVRAVFNPAKEHINTLRDEMEPLIGKEAIFQYSWIMDEDDMFPGVWALHPVEIRGEFPYRWIPEFDLEIIEQVS